MKVLDVINPGFEICNKATGISECIVFCLLIKLKRMAIIPAPNNKNSLMPNSDRTRTMKPIPQSCGVFKDFWTKDKQPLK